MGKIIEFGSASNPEYPRSLSDAIILRNIGTLKDGTDLNGKTLTDLINKLFVGSDTFKFLHISDTHGVNVGIPVAKTMMEENPELRFTIVTGDIRPSETMIATMVLSGKFLTMLGNHDVNDEQVTNIVATSNVITPVCADKVILGGNSGEGYWYQDYYTARGKGIRFIAFDEYEQSSTNNAIGQQVAYSQAQMDWFINLLKNTPRDFFLVLCHHQGLASSRVAGYRNLFTSEHAPSSYEFLGGCTPELIPNIMDAYMGRGSFSGTFNCGATSGSDTMTFDVDFSNTTPAKFLMHIGGHTHWDCVEYLPNHPEQLQVLIDRDGNNKYTYSDLTRSDFTYCINQYTINMDTGDILIERIGAKATDGGRSRTSINF